MKALDRQRVLVETKVANCCDPKQIFSYARRRLRAKEDLAVIRRPNGSFATDDSEKAELISRHFATTYEPGEVRVPTPAIIPPGVSQLENVDVEPETVLRYLLRLPGKKSMTPEGVPAIFFKRAAPGLAKPLSLIYKRSLAEGVIPEGYRTAIIAPVHKSGDKTDPANKRPVSLTAVSCKVIERILADQIYVNANAQCLLSDEQFAYRPGRSTTQCVLEYLNDLAICTNDRTPVDTLMFDLKNAFEMCDHDTLVSVLPTMGIGQTLRQWISDFLRRRTFRVRVGAHLSSEVKVTRGCPQGTVLGSICFLMYFDCVKRIFPPEIRFKIYADDLKIYALVRSEDERRRLQKAADDFLAWTERMGLRVSSSKCCVFHYGSNNPCHQYFLGDKPLEVRSEIKDLGIHITEKLDFQSHVTHVLKKAARITNWIMRAFTLRRPGPYL